MTLQLFITRFKLLWKSFWMPEELFEKEYLERRIKDINIEIMEMPIKDRLKFITTLESKVFINTGKEKQEYITKIEEINKQLELYEKV